MSAAGVAADSVTFSSMMSVRPAKSDAGEAGGAVGGGQPSAQKAYARAAEWLAAMQELGVQPTAVCYNKLISCCARARLPELALEWLESMTDAGLSPDVVSYSATISAYAKVGNSQKARALLRRMVTDGIRADTVALNAVLEAYARADEVEQAAGLLRRMERGEMSAPVDCVSYTLVISCVARQGDFRRAEGLLQQMREAGVARDLGCYNALMREYSNHGKLEKAQRLLSELQLDGIEANEWTYGPPLEAARRLRNPRFARSLGRQMLLGRAPLSSFCLASLRRSLGIQGLQTLCRECDRLSHPAVKMALAKGGTQKRDAQQRGEARSEGGGI